MREYLRKRLDEVRSQLTSELDIEHGLLNVLLSKEVINADHLDKIRRLPTRREKVEELLDILKMRDDDAYNNFRSAVRDIQPHLVELYLVLEPVCASSR